MLIPDQSLKAASYWLQKQTVILPKDVQIQYTAGTLQSKHAAVKTALYGFMNSFYQPFFMKCPSGLYITVVLTVFFLSHEADTAVTNFHVQQSSLF